LNKLAYNLFTCGSVAGDYGDRRPGSDDDVVKKFCRLLVLSVFVPLILMSESEFLVITLPSNRFWINVLSVCAHP